jgi:hypothetical protein
MKIKFIKVCDSIFRSDQIKRLYRNGEHLTFICEDDTVSTQVFFNSEQDAKAAFDRIWQELREL